MNLKHLNRVLLQLLLLPVLALSVLLGVFIWGMVSATRSQARIQQADQGIETGIQIGEHTVDEETGLRGYQVTNDPVFLQPYTAAQTPLGREFSRLRQNVALEGLDPKMVDRIVAAHEQWTIAVAQPLIAATRNGIDTRGDATNLGGKQRMDLIRGRIVELNSTIRARRVEAVDRFHRTVRRTVVLAIVLTVLIALLIGVFSRAQLHSVSSAFNKAMEAMRRNARDTQASEERLRTILKSIGDAVVVCDKEGRIEMLNATAQALTGWREAEAIRRPIDQVLTFVTNDAGRARLPLPLDDILAGFSSHAAITDALLLSRTGATVFVEALAAPVATPYGAIAGAVMVFRDVTAQRHTQAALLASEKFAVAGRLAATIAHEIHNPLDAIINLLYLLRQKPNEADREHFLEMASGELDRVARISRAMLGMYRESKSAVSVDMGEMLQSLLLLLQRNLLDAKVTVETDLQEPIHINGYPAELRQVFTNLLTNALDASPEGGVISIRMIRTPGGVVVDVRDQGVGIDAQTMKNLFQPFFTTKGEKGTGLGLWVSQGIAEKHGGSLRLETRTEGDDHGTDAIVFLPE